MPAAEVILVTQNEDIEGSSTLIHTCSSLDGANTVLDDITFANLDGDNCKAYRGMLTDARTIPEKFLGCTPYIIVQLPGQEETTVDYVEAYFEKAPMSPEGLQTRVQELLSQDLTLDTEDGVSVVGMPTIDDIYILFGIQLPLTLHIGEQDTDEEFEDRLEQLQESLNTTNNVYKESSSDGSEGVLPNMANKVKIKITPKTGRIHQITARLLGACTSDEAAKIVQNDEVSSRIHTGETQPMGAVLDYLIKHEAINQQTAHNLRTHAHFVVALESIADNVDIVKIPIATRQLYVSPPIKLTTEYVHTAACCRAIFECFNDTTISMVEIPAVENVNA